MLLLLPLLPLMPKLKIIIKGKLVSTEFHGQPFLKRFYGHTAFKQRTLCVRERERERERECCWLTA